MRVVFPFVHLIKAWIQAWKRSDVMLDICRFLMTERNYPSVNSASANSEAMQRAQLSAGTAGDLQKPDKLLWLLNMHRLISQVHVPVPLLIQR